MKKILIITIGLFLLVGCSKEKDLLDDKSSDTLTPVVKEEGSLSLDSPVTAETTPELSTEPTTSSTTTSNTTTSTTMTSTTTKSTTTTKKTTKKITTTKATTKSTTKKTTTKKTTTTKPSITTPVGLTEEKAHEILLSLKSEYPEGYPWNDNTWSDFHGGNYSGGWGCVGFTYMASDRIFGNLPVTRITDFSKIRVGDIFRYQNGSYGHSVIVLEVKSDRIVVVEGNWQKKVHWNREITFDYMKKYGKYIYTRWPK